MILLGAGYFASAWLGRFLSGSGGTVVSYWLPGGLFVAGLLLNKTRDWPWLMLSIVPANALFDVWHDLKPNFLVIFLFCLTNIIQAGSGAWLVRRFVAEKPSLKSLKEFFGLMFFSGVIGSSIGATIAALMSIEFHFKSSFVDAWEIIWGGDMMAVLVLAPLILVFFGTARKLPPNFLTFPRLAEAFLIIAGLVLSSWYVLVQGGGVNSPKAPILIFMLWAGLRFGLQGGSLAVFLLAVIQAFLTTHYLQGLTNADKEAGTYVFTLQVFVAVAALVGLVPAIVLAEHNETMARLRDSESRYRTLNDAAFEGVIISENGRILDMNDQGLKMFGYERSEIVGMQIVELVAEESKAMVAEGLQQEAQLIYGHKVLRKDGKFFYAEAQARMVLVDGRRLRMTALRDITERKLGEEALRVSEEKFSKAFRSSPDGMSVSELATGRFIEANEGYGKLYGYTREEMIGRTSLELGIWENLQDRMRFIELLNNTGSVRNLEIRTRTRTGSLRIIHLSAEPIILDGTTCLVSVLHDITDRIQAEQALRASEESLRATIENTPYVAVQWFDRQGRVTFWNPASERLYGWTAAAARGKTLDALYFTREEATQFQQIIAGVEQTGKPYGPAEFSFHNSNGGSGVALSTVFQILTPSGESRFVSMNVDLTQRKQAEEANQSQRQVLEMIAAGRPMAQTLDALLRMIESQTGDVLCSILLLDADGVHVRHAAAPSLPEPYVQAINGQAIGPAAGSCGTAAYRRTPVFVTDIATDPLWADYRGLAEAHGLRACWSTPIFDAQKNVLGTFAIYKREPGLPNERHRQLIAMATHTAAICISRHRAETEREQSVVREQQARVEYTLQLIAAQEAERKRIAAELHDSMGQNLLLIKNLAEMALRATGRPGEMHDHLTNINQLAVQCITEARQISRDLRPFQLDHLGLRRALEAMLEQTAQASQVHFTFKFEPVDELFSPDAALNLYRIVQESLNNILKHSGARQVNVQLERDIHEVQLLIEDDGVGFVPEKAGARKGLGLKNITERVRMLGGKLDLVSAPGKGTRISVTIPLVEKHA